MGTTIGPPPAGGRVGRGARPGRGGHRRVAVVGLSSPDTGHAFMTGVVRAARECGGWRVGLMSPAATELTGRPSVRPHGVLLMSSAASLAPVLADLGLAVVAVNFIPAELGSEGGVGKRTGAVLPDETAVGPMVAEHLRSQGLRRLVYVGFDHPVSRARGEGFLAASRRWGLEVLELGSYWPWTRATSPVQLAWAIRRLPRPMGVFAFNDEIAMTVVDAALRLGWRVPDDVAVVGADNTRLRWQLASVPLSSVDLRLEELGYRSARMLGEMLRGGAPPPVERIRPAGVVVRASSDILAIADPVVADAVRLVRSEACEALTAAEVIARAPAVSRSTLERRFRAVLGRSIGEEIRRVRLERARELIETGGLSLTEIALQCGFSDLPHLTRQFTRAFGKPPSAWRSRT